LGLKYTFSFLPNPNYFLEQALVLEHLPNTQACNIDLAMPGVLPVLNEEVLKMAIKLGSALNANILIAQQALPERTIFILTLLKAIKLVKWIIQ
jgi:hypothetical protein